MAQSRKSNQKIKKDEDIFDVEKTRKEAIFSRYNKDKKYVTIKEMRAIGEIVLYPDKRLRIKCGKVEIFDKTLRSMVEQMFYLMKKYRGIGLSANQAGYGKQIFVCNITGKKEDDLVFINPEIVEAVGKEDMVEGCLSLPFVQVMVTRPKKCKIVSQNIDGETFTQDVDGMLARVICHEQEHLDGKLMIDKMKITDSVINRGIIKKLKMVDFEMENKK